jgi:hypothetical protein
MAVLNRLARPLLAGELTIDACRTAARGLREAQAIRDKLLEARSVHRGALATTCGDPRLALGRQRAAAPCGYGGG